MSQTGREGSHYVGDGCLPPHETDPAFAQQQGLRLRPGDQKLPAPNDGPSMHDLVCEDLGALAFPGAPRLMADLNARRKLGLDRYGSLLQARNGRDALLDLYEELQDAAVYARQLVEEREDADAYRTYLAVLGLLMDVGGRHHEC
jgi:hypothetical protein